MSDLQTPPSPGVGARRKGPKVLPKLPLSAFSPPNSGVSESFPLPPSPSTVHPDRVVDASVRGPLTTWSKQWKGTLEGRAKAVVVSASEGEFDGLQAQAAEVEVEIIAAQIPFRLEDGVAPTLPTAKFPVSLSATYTTASDPAIAGLSAALSAGHIVDIDVNADVDDMDNVWEGLEDILTKGTSSLPSPTTGAIVLGNILPPPHDLELPIVKLLTHPTYQSYQSHIAALSLVQNLYVKFLPPSWNAPTPPTPPAGDLLNVGEDKQKKEWKRRIKMYRASRLLVLLSYQC
ncbi:hypothetical protein OF83DRAFT_1115887 [Amylostereum chailletii]|nr:hypothetical protein OF83DRAFT_1115887 [Amylostereum chailletii]